MSIRLGTAKIDITPSVQLAGFASRKGKGTFQSISDRLYARVVFLQSDPDEERGSSAVIVSADVLSVSLLIE